MVQPITAPSVAVRLAGRAFARCTAQLIPTSTMKERALVGTVMRVLQMKLAHTGVSEVHIEVDRCPRHAGGLDQMQDQVCLVC